MGTLGLALLVCLVDAGLGEYKLVLAIGIGVIGLGLLGLAAVQSFAWRNGN